MIKRENAEQNGYKTLDAESQPATERQEKIEQLKNLMPSFVNGEGKVDITAIKNFIGEEDVLSANQGYGLTFAGKGIARVKADEPTKQELKVELEQSKNFDTTENIIIRGDNIDALKILRQNYGGKVKLIYIDPPYNTGNATFTYNDTFKEREADIIEKYGIDDSAVNFFEDMHGTLNHSGWLYAMYPRLRLARDLLSDDGVIFISIDDNEQANLKIMCDEIFGPSNFETAMIWRKTGKQSNTKRINRLKCTHEYILCVFKNRAQTELRKIKLFPEWEKAKATNRDDDPRGAYIGGIMSQTEEKSDPKSDNYYTITTPSGREVTREFFFPKSEYDRLNNDNRLYFSKNGDGAPTLKIFKDEEQSYYFDSIIDRMGTFTDAKEEIGEILNNKDIFDTPKPTKLIKEIVRCCTYPSDIILDFFAGSGSTAQAVMDLNKDDGGNRKFILIQLDEEIDEKKSKPAYDFCMENKFSPVISSICIERVNRAGDKIKEEKDLLCGDFDIGYKTFSLSPRPQLTTDDEGQIKFEYERSNKKDALYNMISLSAENLLTDKIEEIEPDLLYKINNAYYLLGACKTDLKSADRVFVDGYADISLEKWLNTLGLDKDKVSILY